MKYFFIIGHNPVLSIAEIVNLHEFGREYHKWNICETSDEILILETKEELDVKILQERLGGTIKIGQILTQTNADFTRTNADLFLKELPASGRIYFGFSIYKLEEGVNLKKIEREVKSLAIEIKRKLKQRAISSRWVSSKERFLSSVIVQKNKLLTHGSEFVFLVGKSKIYFGKTLSCQEFREYGIRDFGRPERRIKEGMLPPKLAKIMINLAQSPESSLILDPFCGSGTILQEAALMGYKVIGCDISEEAVRASEDNIKWLLKNPKSDPRLDRGLNSKQILNSKFQILKCDVKRLSENFKVDSIDAIVSEPYLGPAKIFNFQFSIFNLIKELSELYLIAFQEFKKVLKKEGRVVIVFPIFKTNGQLCFLPILDEIKKVGFIIIKPISKELENNLFIKITNRSSIIYSRPDQKVLREIFIFERVKSEKFRKSLLISL